MEEKARWEERTVIPGRRNAMVKTWRWENVLYGKGGESFCLVGWDLWKGVMGDQTRRARRTKSQEKEPRIRTGSHKKGRGRGRGYERSGVWESGLR